MDNYNNNNNNNNNNNDKMKKRRNTLFIKQKIDQLSARNGWIKPIYAAIKLFKNKKVVHSKKAERLIFTIKMVHDQIFCEQKL